MYTDPTQSYLTLSLSQVNPDDVDSYHRMLELWFLFCLIWSIGASVDEESRKKMDTFIRELEGQFPAKVHVMQYVVHCNECLLYMYNCFCM